jgi:hypothetical protein
MEKFLHSDVDKFALSTKCIFVKIRISNSNLNIERGRYIKLPVEKRIYPLCNIESEDEIHFILKCPIYFSSLTGGFLSGGFCPRPKYFCIYCNNNFA